MKKKKAVKKLCGAIYEDGSGRYTCGKVEDHHGSKHLCTDGNVFVSWSDEGVARQTQEMPHGVDVE